MCSNLSQSSNLNQLRPRQCLLKSDSLKLHQLALEMIELRGSSLKDNNRDKKKDMILNLLDMLKMRSIVLSEGLNRLNEIVAIQNYRFTPVQTMQARENKTIRNLFSAWICHIPRQYSLGVFSWLLLWSLLPFSALLMPSIAFSSSNKKCFLLKSLN